MCWIFIPVDKISWQETKVSGPVLRSILVGDVALWCPETSGISVKKIIECNIKNTIITFVYHMLQYNGFTK